MCSSAEPGSNVRFDEGPPATEPRFLYRRRAGQGANQGVADAREISDDQQD